MSESKEYKFAEVSIDSKLMELFSQEQSPYHQDESTKNKRANIAKHKKKLTWHIRNSLSPRQKQTLTLILSGKTEREAAVILGITQQVVHIHKKRAIKKLQEKFNY